MTTSSFLQRARRRTVELLTVFLGVALAFVAENWREDLADRRDERVAIAGLLTDFTANQESRDQLLTNQARLVAGASALLSLLSGSQDGAMVSVPDTMLMAVIGRVGGYRPDRGTIDGLVNSGRLELISDDELRAAIAAWPSKVADVDFLFAAEYEALEPMLAYGVRVDLPLDQLTAGYFSWLRSSGPTAESGSISIRNSMELRFETLSRVNLGNFGYEALTQLAATEDSILHFLAQVD